MYSSSDTRPCVLTCTTTVCSFSYSYHIGIYTYYHRTLSSIPHDCLPTLEPGTRSRISAIFMARGGETPRAHQGVLLRWGGAIRALVATCKLSGNPRRSIFGSWALHERNVSGGRHREQNPGGEKYNKLFSVGEDQTLYTPVSLHRLEECCFSGENCSKQSYRGALRALPRTLFTTLEPGTKFRTFARFMARRHETRRAHQRVLLGSES